MAIQDHFRRTYNMAIGLRTAEAIKIEVGAVMVDMENPPEPKRVRGKDLIDGIPVTRLITYSEVAEVLERSVSTIEHGIIQTLETCPPELAADIYESGLHITGGSALLRGLKQRFERKIQLPVHINEDAIYSVSKGISKVLKNPSRYPGILFE
jgi:rod shape-determining protein MreB